MCAAGRIRTTWMLAGVVCHGEKRRKGKSGMLGFNICVLLASPTVESEWRQDPAGEL
jgi:hypothetical protein